MQGYAVSCYVNPVGTKLKDYRTCVTGTLTNKYIKSVPLRSTCMLEGRVIETKDRKVYVVGHVRIGTNVYTEANGIWIVRASRFSFRSN
jgi:hypothetical protein